MLSPNSGIRGAHVASLELDFKGFFGVQVMGTPSDACKIKFQASSTDEASSYTHWDSGATLATSVSIIAYAAIKFSVFADKSSSKF